MLPPHPLQNLSSICAPWTIQYLQQSEHCQTILFTKFPSSCFPCGASFFLSCQTKDGNTCKKTSDINPKITWWFLLNSPVHCVMESTQKQSQTTSTSDPTESTVGATTVFRFPSLCTRDKTTLQHPKGRKADFLALSVGLRARKLLLLSSSDYYQINAVFGLFQWCDRHKLLTLIGLS